MKFLNVVKKSGKYVKELRKRKPQKKNKNLGKIFPGNVFSWKLDVIQHFKDLQNLT